MKPIKPSFIKKRVAPVDHNVVPLRPENTTVEIALRDALAESKNYKNVVITMLDANDEPSIWSTTMTAAQFTLVGAHTTNFGLAMSLGSNNDIEYEGGDE